jgi:hypothetical protein
MAEEARRWTARARELRRKQADLDSSDLAAAALEQQLALAVAMVDYEVLLTARLPEDLEFMVEDWRRDSGVPAWEQVHARQLRTAEDSRRRVGTFFESTTQCTRAMSELHAEAAARGDAEVAVFAVLREATIAIAFDDALDGGGLSRELRRWERDARERGERLWVEPSDAPYLDIATKLLEQCIEYGTAWGADGETLEACFAWQSALDPRQHPALAELVPEFVARSSVQRHGLIAPAELDE